MQLQRMHVRELERAEHDYEQRHAREAVLAAEQQRSHAQETSGLQQQLAALRQTGEEIEDEGSLHERCAELLLALEMQ